MESNQSTQTRVPPDGAALSKLMRRLWVDNISWMTALMYTIIYGPGEIGPILKRLERNRDEISSVFDQFYAKDTGDMVRQNMDAFLELFVPLVQAYREEDIPAIERQRNALFDLADTFAEQLSKINSEWDMAEMQALFYEMIHRDEEEIVRIKLRDYARSIQAHDEQQELMYRLADMLVYGILRQFRDASQSMEA